MSLWSEIHEQPEVLKRLLRTQAVHVAEVAREITARRPEWVLLAARGSSDNAGLFAQYLWGARNRLSVAMATPSLFTHYGTPPRLDGALVVAISQSGQSPDVVSVVTEARRQGAPTLVITNEPSSPLAAAADMVIPTGAGAELAIAATKTYTSQLLAVAMLSAALPGGEDDGAALARVPGAARATLQLDEAIASVAARYTTMPRCVVLGRGFHYATACEWALKLEELTYVVAEPYSTADFRHGPAAMAAPGFPVLAVVPAGAVYRDHLALLATLVNERGVDLVALSDEKEALALARSPIRLPRLLPEWLSPITAVLAAQLWSYRLAEAMGRDTEAPRGLSKVTETW
ncbi:MAG TPA: SIS domain-containing protein [Thermoanaerobaculia bacterium]|nr:SIS domain-containing protein [Thermoanaerobaculia bacterium]